MPRARARACVCVGSNKGRDRSSRADGRKKRGEKKKRSLPTRRTHWLLRIDRLVASPAGNVDRRALLVESADRGGRTVGDHVGRAGPQLETLQRVDAWKRRGRGRDEIRVTIAQMPRCKRATQPTHRRPSGCHRGCSPEEHRCMRRSSRGLDRCRAQADRQPPLTTQRTSGRRPVVRW